MCVKVGGWDGGVSVCGGGGGHKLSCHLSREGGGSKKISGEAGGGVVVKISVIQMKMYPTRPPHPT